MGKLRILLAGFVAVGAIAVLGQEVADAATPTLSNEEQCAKLSIEEANLAGLGSPAKFSKSQFTKAAKAFRSAAKVAPAKVQAAMNTMAAYYEKIAKAGSANKAVTAISAKDTEKYSKATIVWSTYVTKVCA